MIPLHKQQHVLVLGAGKSGLSAVRFLLSKDYAVSLYDGSEEEKPVYVELRSKGVAVFPGKVPSCDFAFAVISPGIPLTDPCAAALLQAGIPVIGELELASRYIKKPIIGITGTNGKTTTTALTGEIFKHAGYRTFVGGNIGIPLLESLNEEYDFYVVEMSSFQLETICTLDAAVSVYLNLTPDHLNRHGDMAGYLAAKGNMAACQSSRHFTVLNCDDNYIESLKEKTGGTPVYISQKKKVSPGVCLDESGNIIFTAPGGNSVTVMKASELRLPGPHNLENAMGASAAALLMGVSPAVIADTLRGFEGVEHRMEDIGTYNGVRWVNDSKATNPDSVFKALASYGDAPIVLIGGGRNKGNCFDELGLEIAKKCKALIVTGEAAEDMAASAKKAGLKDISVVDDMEAAVLLAKEKAVPGDVALLSPANASFDQFNSFEHRGEVFKEIVHRAVCINK